MIRADQALDEILLVVIDGEEPQEVLRLNAEALIEKFKADTSAFHQALANTGDIVANELAKLRDALDREIERRVDDVADNVCDLAVERSLCTSLLSV
jgi:RNA processing factor Prp31